MRYYLVKRKGDPTLISLHVLHGFVVAPGQLHPRWWGYLQNDESCPGVSYIVIQGHFLISASWREFLFLGESPCNGTCGNFGVLMRPES